METINKDIIKILLYIELLNIAMVSCIRERATDVTMGKTMQALNTPLAAKLEVSNFKTAKLTL